MAIREWYEQVGGVSLLGWHSSLSPNPDEPANLSDGAPDPLLMLPLRVHLTMAADEQKRSGGKLRNFMLCAGAPGADRYWMQLLICVDLFISGQLVFGFFQQLLGFSLEGFQPRKSSSPMRTQSHPFDIS